MHPVLKRVHNNCSTSQSTSGRRPSQSTPHAGGGSVKKSLKGGGPTPVSKALGKIDYLTIYNIV